MSFEYKIARIIEEMNFSKATAKQIAARLGMKSGYEIKEITKVLDKLVKEGKLFMASGRHYSKTDKITYRGVLRGNKRHFAFLIREDGGDDLFVPARHLNGAQHGDTVVASIVKGDEARVEKVVERGISRLVGTFEKHDYFGYVVPDGNCYYTDVKVPLSKSLGAKHNSKVVVEIEQYGEKLNGRIVEIIGAADSRESDVLSILKSYGFDNVFPPEVEDEARKMTYKSTGNRDSFIDMPTITIDGDDSKDFDDAVSLVKIGEKYKLYVHIADVSHYVTSGSVLDKEAFKRCTSVYFPGSVYPMLPEVLSNGLCSLNEGEDRLALTCVMVINKDGVILNSYVTKSIINSNHRMTYANVTKLLEGDKELRERYADVTPMIEDMAELARILNRKRYARGNIDITTHESRIILDENGGVKAIEPYPYTFSNAIIEEFMLAANESVAEYAVKHDLPCVYRVHGKPDKEKMRDFRKFLAGLGLKLPNGEIEPVHLQKLLESLKGEPLADIVNKVMLRSMQKAKYSTACDGHFGLAAEYYCHFTSPIRRYPDLQVHRALKAHIDREKINENKWRNRCSEVADASSEREVAAERAERDIDDYYKTIYMKKYVGERFDGIVSGVTSFGVFVELENTCEGLSRLDNLPRDEYNFIEERYLMKGRNHSYAIGQRVSIEVLDCDVASRRVSFKILE